MFFDFLGSSYNKEMAILNCIAIYRKDIVINLTSQISLLKQYCFEFQEQLLQNTFL